MAEAVYTHGHQSAVLRSHRSRTAGNSAGYLLERLRPGLELLDVGCGPGTITADLAAIVAPGRVVAIDASADVLTGAQQVAAERGLSNVAFGIGDVHALEFDDDTFDVVHAHQVLQHVGDPVGALREMRRVCKPQWGRRRPGCRLRGDDLVPGEPGARRVARALPAHRAAQRW